MKRLLRAAIPLLVLMACVVGNASAFPMLSDPIPVSFRYFNSTTPAGFDSAYAAWNSSGTQAALVADTTAWFTLPGLAVANFPAYADSIPLLQMILRPGPTSLSVCAADSFTFTLQGSLDGASVAMSAPAIDILELGTSNSFGRLWNSTRLGAFNGVTATNVNMYGFPFYRVIVKDFTGTTGHFQMEVRYWLDRP